MKKAVSWFFRITVPLLCLLTAASVLLIGVELHPAEETTQTISAFLTAYRAETTNKATFEEGGRVFLLHSAEDGYLSAAELIGISNKAAGWTPAAPLSAADAVCTELSAAVSNSHVPVLILLCAALLFMLTAAITGTLRPAKGTIIVAAVCATLFAAGLMAIVLLLHLKTAADISAGGHFAARISSASMLPLTGAALSSVLCWGYLIAFAVSGGGQSASGVLVYTGTTVDLLRRPQASFPDERPRLLLQPQPVPEPAAVPQKQGLIIGLSGQAKGLQVPVMPESTVVLGRDAKLCNIVLESPKISRRHCSVCYFEEREMFAVKDYSQNGVFTEEGVRLMNGHFNLLPPDSVIRLADDENTFRLSVE